jgi:hypothetical protein
MLQVFVETNWVFGFAAPAHHKEPAALELLERSRRGEIRLHLPSLCLMEVRTPLTTRCRPRNDAGAIRAFARWRREASRLSTTDFDTVDRLLNQFESSVTEELAALSQTLLALKSEPNLEIFSLNEEMLAMAVRLEFADLSLQPFDQSVLAAVLVRARELWDAGERELCFCEKDRDLWPYDQHEHLKPQLAESYRDARVWVYEDFKMSRPVRPPGWPLNQTPGQPTI